VCVFVVVVEGSACLSRELWTLLPTALLLRCGCLVLEVGFARSCPIKGRRVPVLTVTTKYAEIGREKEHDQEDMRVLDE
jgi:hypothetical protein